MTAELHFMSIAELSDNLRSRKVSSREATQNQLERIARLDGALHSYAWVAAEEALSAADAADSEIGCGQYRGPLHGVPIGIKDVFHTRGIPTAAGMAIHKNFRPVEDATAVARLKRAGAVVLGKLQMTEGAYSDYHPSTTPVRNAWNAGTGRAFPQAARPWLPPPAFAMAQWLPTRAARSDGHATPTE
jgi:amidase